MKIKQHILAGALFALMLTVAISPITSKADDASNPEFVASSTLCGIFDSSLLPIQMETSRRLDSLDKQNRVKKITPILARYQRILANEGYTISSAEVGGQEFRRTTAAATVKFQQKYLTQIRAASPAFEPTGYLDDDTRDFINRRYVCQKTAVIQLFNAQNYDDLKTGDTLSVKYRTIGLPTGSTLLFYGYDVDGSKNKNKTLLGTMTTTAPSATSSAATVSSFDWTIPTYALSGTYRVGVAIKDLPGSEKFTEAFKVYKRPLAASSVTTVVSPNGGETYTVGDTVQLSWLNATTNSLTGISVHLIDTASSTDVAILQSRGGGVNSRVGTYSWRIPRQIGALDLQAASKNVYKIKVVNGVSTSSSDMSDATFTIVPTSVQAATSTTAATGTQSDGTVVTSPFRYTITPTKTTYKKGENIRFKFSATNTATTSVVAMYPTGCWASYTINGSDASSKQACTMATSQFTFSPGETRSIDFVHPAAVVTGQRLIRVQHIGQGFATTTVTVTQ